MNAFNGIDRPRASSGYVTSVRPSAPGRVLVVTNGWLVDAKPERGRSKRRAALEKPDGRDWVVGCPPVASGERQQCEGQLSLDPQCPLWVPSPPLATSGRTFVDGHKLPVVTDRCHRRGASTARNDHWPAGTNPHPILPSCLASYRVKPMSPLAFSLRVTSAGSWVDTPPKRDWTAPSA